MTNLRTEIEELLEKASTGPNPCPRNEDGTLDIGDIYISVEGQID